MSNTPTIVQIRPDPRMTVPFVGRGTRTAVRATWHLPAVREIMRPVGQNTGLPPVTPSTVPDT